MNDIFHITANKQMEDKAIDRLSELLHSEIERIRSDYKRHGWTKWAVIGSIGSIFWLIADTIEQRDFNLTNIGMLFLAFSFFLYALFFLSRIFEHPRSNSSVRDRFFLTNRCHAPFRWNIALILTQITSIIIVAYWVREQVIGYLTVLVYIVYGLLGLLVLLILILTYLPIPMPIAQTNLKISIIFNIIFGVCSFIMAAAYLNIVLHSHVLATIDDYRIAALIVAIFYLSYVLVGQGRQSPLLESLSTIRRELLLGRMDVVTATQQTDIALTGLRISEVLHEDVQGLIDGFEALNTELSKVSEKATAVRATIKKMAEKEATEQEQDILILESLLKSFNLHITKIRTILKEVDRHIQQFERKAMLLPRGSKRVREAIKKVYKQALEANEKARTRFIELEKASKEMDKDFVKLIRK